MRDNKIKVLTDREHVLLRPNQYLGSTNMTEFNDFFMEGDKIEYKKDNYVPALYKMFGEITDNSVDEAVRTDYQYANNITITIKNDYIEVEDNGRGIPVEIEETTGEYGPVLAWCRMKAGSNFDDAAGRKTAGMNGVGAAITNIFSIKFQAETSDGVNKLTLKTWDNMGDNDVKVEKSNKKYTKVRFYPDFSRLECTGFEEVYGIIHQRILMLAIQYPKIKFKFNNKIVSPGSLKKFMSLFGDSYVSIDDDNFNIGIFSNDTDDFKFYSYCNSLHLSHGGNHINLITNKIVSGIREKLIKKFKNIKNGDIKNKLKLIVLMRDFENFETNSQTKSSLDNSISELNNYFNSIDYDKIINKIMKTPEIIDPITEVYRIKEEFKKRQELKALDKTVKKIKSDKYLPSIGRKKYLMIVEGESALGGTLGVFGRTECGYYILKGKPLNAYSSTQAKFVANAELSELYKVVTNEGYDYILTLTDQDLDGIHIRGLLTGFIHKYLPDFKAKFGMLQTPVIGITKNEKMVRWYYNLSENISLKSGEKSNYFKGLGSWVKEDLQQIVQTDGLEKMIDIIDFNNDEIIDDWLSDTKSDKRKEYIQGNVFSIAKA